LKACQVAPSVLLAKLEEASALTAISFSIGDFRG
jgi:hypothetical protein